MTQLSAIRARDAACEINGALCLSGVDEARMQMAIDRRALLAVVDALAGELRQATDVIRTWHGRSAPEMKQIRDALSSLDGQEHT